METDQPEPQWLARARRLGPLPYSALDPLPLGPPSPVEPLAHWLVDTLDEWWRADGRPDPYTAVVVSGDDATLARRVLALGPECLAALRYVMVGPSSAAHHGRAGELVPLEEPSFLFPSGPPDAAPSGMDDFGEPATPATGIGPLVALLGEVPSLSVVDTGVAVVAVQSLSRLPSDRVEWRQGQWWEIRAGAEGSEPVEVAIPLGTRPPGVPDAADEGSRFALLSGAAGWLQRTLRAAPSGRLGVVDAWTAVTEPSGSACPPLALDQLRRIREPLEPAPVDLFEGISVVAWRMG